jgi:hypothetical protein
MKPLIIKGDETTPLVDFNAQTGVLVMGGLAIPEDVKAMFSPMKMWIEEYSKKPQPATELILHFEYLNTAATKIVFELSNMISNLHSLENCRVKITWQYSRGDLEMLELGEEILEEFICLTEIKAIDDVELTL